MNEANISVVEYEDRDEDTGSYIVKKIPSGEVIFVPAVSSIFILKLEKGQVLIFVQPPGYPEGYLLAPI